LYRLGIITTLTLLCGLLCYSVFYHLNNALIKQQDAVAAIPLDAAIILESNNLQQVWSTFSETNLLWNEFLINSGFNAVDKQLKKLDSTVLETRELKALVHNQKALISFHPVNESVEVFLVTNCELIEFEEIVHFINSTSKSSSLIASPNSEVLKFEIDSSTYFISYCEPFFLFSSSQEIINQSISQLTSKKNLLTNITFEQLRSTASPSSNLHLYIQKNNGARLLENYFKEEFIQQIKNSNEFLDWIALDLILKPNSILLSGISSLSLNASNEHKVQLQPSISKQGYDQMPSKISSLKRRSIADIKSALDTAYFSIEKYEQNCKCQPVEVLKKLVGNEIIKVCFKDNFRQNYEAVFIEELGHINAINLLKEVAKIDTSIVLVNEIEAHILKDLDFVHLLGFNMPSANRYLILVDNYIVISSKEGCEKIIKDRARNANSTSNSSYVRFTNQYLASNTSKEVYMSGKKLLEFLESVLTEKYQKNASDLVNVFQKIDGLAIESLSSEKGNCHHSIVLSVGQSDKEEAKYLWMLELDSISINPQIMKNHRTNTSEVLVQDFNNTLYLISATGRIKWSKKIEGQIIGNVKQVDLYKNGKWQMLFNTKKHIYLLDINGVEVFDNPIVLKSPATNSVSVLDYDKNLDYRFIIACADNKIYNYNGEGRLVEGWNQFQAKNEVYSPVQYFSISGKDYLFFNDKEGNIYFMNRRGETRYSPTISLADFNKKSIYLSKGNTIENTKLTYVDSLSRISVKSLDGEFLERNWLDTLYSVVSSSIQIADFSDNNVLEYIVGSADKLALYGPDKKLGIYESFNFNLDENLFVLGSSDKYILIEDKKLEEIYLFDSNLSANDIFPVPGSLRTAMGDLNKDGFQELVTVFKGKVIAYTITSEVFY
jgi:hypothetical protein